MGYTTRFTGSFKVSPPLTVPHFLSGSVRWVGEDTSDIGALVVEGNKVTKQTADARTVSVFVPISLIQRHAQEDDAADDIAALVVKSARLQGVL